MLALTLGLLAHVSASTGGTAAAPPPVPSHIQIMSAYGYNSSAQAGWCSFGKSFNLSALLEGYEQHGLPGMYRIDCVGCQTIENGGGKYPPDPGFAAGVVCDHRNCTTCKNGEAHSNTEFILLNTKFIIFHQQSFNRNQTPGHTPLTDCVRGQSTTCARRAGVTP